ncbi:lipooligosaccharide biosynthesis N-acetyl-glucosamine transferase LsgE [Galenea microaerophila]
MKRAIDSVLNQTLAAKEIIIVDDASCAETRNLVESFELSNLHYIENIDGNGASSSRNLGVDKASADYVAFLDDDDLFDSEKIKTVSKYISHHSYDVLYHPAKINMVNEGVFYYSKPKFFEDASLFLKELAVSNIVGGTPMVVVRRNAFIKSGRFDETLDALEDYELWLRMASNGYQFKKLDYPLTECNYITKKNSLSKNIYSNLEALEKIRKKHQKLYNSLDQKAINRHYLWQQRMVVHKLLLNGKILKSFSVQFGVFKKSHNFKDLIILFSLLLGSKFIFMMKARFG